MSRKKRQRKARSETRRQRARDVQLAVVRRYNAKQGELGLELVVQLAAAIVCLPAFGFRLSAVDPEVRTDS